MKQFLTLSLLTAAALSAYAGEPVLLDVTESEATTVAALREDFNHLIVELRKAGLIFKTDRGDAE